MNVRQVVQHRIQGRQVRIQVDQVDRATPAALRTHPHHHSSAIMRVGGPGGRPSQPFLYASNSSEYPIRYGTGEISLSAIDLQSNGYGMPWGVSRNFCNVLTQIQGIGVGYNWQVSEWPYLVVDYLGNVTVMGPANKSLWFDFNGSTFTERFGMHDVLTLNISTGQYRLAQQDGTVTLFDQATGMFRQQIAPGGSTTTVTAMAANGYNFSLLTRICG